MNPAVLVVSENPVLLHHAFGTLRPYGLNVVGCLGPARGPCKLETDSTCPLALHSWVVIVDSPDSGLFRNHGKAVPVADYAAELAERHPRIFSILCGAPEGRSGATGGTAVAASATSVVEILRQVAIASCPPDVGYDNAARAEGASR